MAHYSFFVCLIMMLAIGYIVHNSPDKLNSLHTFEAKFVRP